MKGESDSIAASSDGHVGEADLREELHNDLKKKFVEKLESKSSITAVQRNALVKMLDAEAPTSSDVFRALRVDENEGSGEHNE